jgi:hypothetical protein
MSNFLTKVAAEIPSNIDIPAGYAAVLYLLLVAGCREEYTDQAVAGLTCLFNRIEGTELSVRQFGELLESQRFPLPSSLSTCPRSDPLTIFPLLALSLPGPKPLRDRLIDRIRAAEDDRLAHPERYPDASDDPNSEY